jgi:pimeloyl-ACP methyl ester carboxylesterase
MMKEDAGAMQAQVITLSGQPVHFWKGGAGPAVLLLHAAWGDAELSWNRSWNDLARSCTVVAPDLPGFGRSSSLSRPSLPGMASRLKELIDALQLDRVVVIGNSFGAAVAIQFAHGYPKAVSHLVLVDGGYAPLIPGPLRSIIALPVVKQLFARIIRYLTFSRRTLKRSFADLSKLPAGFIETIQGTARAYSGISFDTIMNMTEPLAKPVVPTLLVWGERDGLATMQQAEALRKWMPDARFVTIKDAGHMPQVERPQEFVAMISGVAVSGKMR